MSKHKIKVTQVFKATRTIEIEVEAEDIENALEEVDSGGVDIPSFDDPRWKTGWRLENEEVESA